MIEALDAGKRPHLVGDKSELMQMLRGVQLLKEGEPTSCPAFFGFKNWTEVVELARTDEGAHLVPFVNLVETRGEKQLMWALNRSVEAEGADIVISTAHKSKGREWKSVRLMDDFLRSSPSVESKAGPDPSELRLLYVALTRAKEQLDVPEPIVEFIERGVAPQRERLGTPQSRPQRTPIKVQAAAQAVPATPEPEHPLKSQDSRPESPRHESTPRRRGLLG